MYLVVLVISPWGFERISTVTIMCLLYSVNAIFNVVIEIHLYFSLFYSIRNAMGWGGQVHGLAQMSVTKLHSTTIAYEGYVGVSSLN